MLGVRAERKIRLGDGGVREEAVYFKMWAIILDPTFT
jgi:hypothetical protein